MASEKPGPGPGLEPQPVGLIAVGAGGGGGGGSGGGGSGMGEPRGASGSGSVVLPAGMINPSVPIRNIRMKFAVLIGLIQVGEVSNRDIVETVLNLKFGHKSVHHTRQNMGSWGYRGHPSKIASHNQRSQHGLPGGSRDLFRSSEIS
ncbi:uncharacterized protein RBU33_017582 isoform 1-T2 [Hipposideros larvatus]